MPCLAAWRASRLLQVPAIMTSLRAAGITNLVCLCLQALRALKAQHVHQIKFELQQRVAEMRGIDARLHQLASNPA